MPTVPDYGGRKVEPTPTPGVRQTGPGGAAETPESAGAGIGGAIADLGATGVHVGLQAREIHERIHQEEQQRADEVSLLAADRQLGDLDHELRTSALTVKGRETLPLYESTLGTYDQRAADIANTLTNDRQKAAFAQRREQRRESLGSVLDTHTRQQMAQYDADEFKGWQDNTISDAIRAAADGADDWHTHVGSKLADGVDQIQRFAGRNGLGPEASDAMVADFRTKVHVGIINELIDQGKDRDAATYFKEAKGEIDGREHAGIEKRLDVATTAAAGLQAAETLWQQHGPKTDLDPIRIADMETAARARFADDPKTLDATIGYLRERKAGVDAQRQDVAEATASTVYKAIAGGAGLAQVTRMPEFQALPGKEQDTVREHILVRADAAANRLYNLSGQAFEQAQRARAQTEQGQQALYYRLANPAVLTAMSENAIQAKRGELGDEMTNKLLEAKGKLTSPAAVRAATINDVLADEIARRAHQNVDVVPSKQSIADLAQIGRLKDAVLSEISAAESGGRALTYEQKKAIGFQIADRTVFLDAKDERTAVTVVNPDDQARAYVPIKQINQTNLDEWANLIRTNVPGAQAFKTTADVVARYQDRIQRAHAAIVMGLGDEEALRRLTSGPSNAPSGPYPENLSIGP